VPIAIRRLVRPLVLSGFAPEYGDDFIQVWVNPSRDILSRYEQIRGDAAGLKQRLTALSEERTPDQAEAQKLGVELAGVNGLLYAWYAEIWSQGEDASKHVTAENVRELSDRCEREDPALWFFLISGTWQLINDHVAYAKKG
jgi:hypothetical protein